MQLRENRPDGVDLLGGASAPDVVTGTDHQVAQYLVCPLDNFLSLGKRTQESMMDIREMNQPEPFEDFGYGNAIRIGQDNGPLDE